MSTVLWLASWYPNKTDPFTGDFIQRQAIATARFRSVILIFVTKDASAKRVVCVHPDAEGNSGTALKEYRIYYPDTPFKSGPLSRLFSFRQYIKQHLKMVRKLKENGEMPALVHVQVAMKAGLIALYLKKKYGIPYVITEHWTGYYDKSPHALKNKGFAFRFFLKKIFQHASYFLPVTRDLGEIINRTITPIPTRVIPNVVDTSLFRETGNQQPQRFRFIHVSSLLPQKNPGGIISAFEQLTGSGMDAELVMVGPPDETLLNLLQEKKFLNNRLFLTGEISYAEVAEQLKKASAFVLFSTVENLPCVILESLCSGIPVISTRVGGIAEVIGKENGILIDPGSESQLLEAMKNMMTGYAAYNTKGISRNAQALYNYDAVGQQFAWVYDELLKK
ncbi:MAG: glycosyltransferase [Puia sp.]